MLTLVAASAVQDVLAPGSLTLEEARADPRQADPRYVAASAGKKSVQLQGGATLQSDTPLGMFSATVYGLIRRLDNPLTFAFIDLDRTAGGGYAQLRNRVGRLDWRVSVDARSQRDIRLNTDHENREEILLDQRERVHSVSLAGALRADVTGRLSATAGVRLDAIRFRMTDHYLLNGDQSGDRDFSAFSPAVGVSYRAGPAVAYASISTAFETPTATELVNRPDGDGGFNASLGPQRTLGYEVGVRGEIPAARLRLDAALFRLHIRDRLLPEQNAEGRTFYHNAGKNSHQGIEVALEWPARHSTTLQITYAGGGRPRSRPGSAYSWLARPSPLCRPTHEAPRLCRRDCGGVGVRHLGGQRQHDPQRWLRLYRPLRGPHELEAWRRACPAFLACAECA